MYTSGYVEGVETPDRLRNLTTALLGHGYSREDVLKILGGNVQRVYRQVWKRRYRGVSPHASHSGG